MVVILCFFNCYLLDIILVVLSTVAAHCSSTLEMPRPPRFDIVTAKKSVGDIFQIHFRHVVWQEHLNLCEKCTSWPFVELPRNPRQLPRKSLGKIIFEKSYVSSKNCYIFDAHVGIKDIQNVWFGI